MVITEIHGVSRSRSARLRVLRTVTGRRLACAFSLLALLVAAPSSAEDQRDRKRSSSSSSKDSGPAAPSAPSEESASYRVGAGDVLNVEVVGRKDLSAQYTVGQDGVLFMPLTGGISAVGKTSTQLAAELARRLSLYDRDITQVNVSVAEFKSRKIFVMGGVVTPGKYSFPQSPTIWDAISEAGGPTEDAQLQAVEIIPGDPTTGGPTHTVDVAAAIREGRVQNLDRLKPGD